MVIVDYELKGNSIRFYLGKYTETYGWLNPDKISQVNVDNICVHEDFYGDDWDDAPYQHNAGQIYDCYVYDTRVINFDFDDVVKEACDFLDVSKDELISEQIPCVLVIPKDLAEELDYMQLNNFAFLEAHPRVIKFYMGAQFDPDDNN